jgi:hypothetical protein
VERSEALRLLPFAHATAVRLREAGAPDSLIADALGIDAEAIGPLLHVADSKLALLSAPEDEATQPDRSQVQHPRTGAPSS